MVVTNNAIDNTIGNTNSGITNTFTVQNLSNTASSQAQINTSVAGTTAGDCWNQFTVGATRSWALGQDNSDSQGLKINTTNGATITPSSGTNVWKMSTAGVRRMPLQPLFIAQKTTFDANCTGNGTNFTLIYDTVNVDQASNYNNATGQFTIPVTGYYNISTSDYILNISVAHTIGEFNIYKNGIRDQSLYYANFANVKTSSASNDLAIATSINNSYTAGDIITVVLTVSGGTKTVTAGGGLFSAFLIY